MRKLALVAFLVLSLMAGVIGFAQAQTPVPGDNEAGPVATELAPTDADAIPGASIEIFADVTTDSGTAGMTLYRITLDPGVEIEAHEHFGSVTWYIDTGTFGFTVVSGEVWARCADQCVPGATPDASGFVLVPEGTEVVLRAGDWIIQHDTTVHAYRNAGDDVVVIDASTTYALEDASSPEADADMPAASPVSGPPIRPRGCRGGCY